MERAPEETRILEPWRGISGSDARQRSRVGYFRPSSERPPMARKPIGSAGP